jgi:hypothetical protein
MVKTQDVHDLVIVHTFFFYILQVSEGRYALEVFKLYPSKQKVAASCRNHYPLYFLVSITDREISKRKEKNPQQDEI